MHNEIVEKAIEASTKAVIAEIEAAVTKVFARQAIRTAVRESVREIKNYSDTPTYVEPKQSLFERTCHE